MISKISLSSILYGKKILSILKLLLGNTLFRETPNILYIIRVSNISSIVFSTHDRFVKTTEVVSLRKGNFS